MCRCQQPSISIAPYAICNADVSTGDVHFVTIGGKVRPIGGDAPGGMAGPGAPHSSMLSRLIPKLHIPGMAKSATPAPSPPTAPATAPHAAPQNPLAVSDHGAVHGSVQEGHEAGHEEHEHIHPLASTAQHVIHHGQEMVGAGVKMPGAIQEAFGSHGLGHIASVSQGGDIALQHGLSGGHQAAKAMGRAAIEQGLEHGTAAGQSAASHAEALGHGHAAIAPHATGAGTDAAAGGTAHAEHGMGHGAGEHEGGEHGSNFGHVMEAVGAIYGSKFSHKIEHWSGLSEKADALYEKMKAEHGAAAPYLHFGATLAATALKGVLTHALSGPGGTLLGGITGGISGGVAGYSKGGAKKAIAGTILGALGGAALGTLGGAISQHGESLIEKAGHNIFAEGGVEGVKGLTGFAAPGLSLATLWVAHILGKGMNKTLGLAQKGAEKLGLPSSVHVRGAGSGEGFNLPTSPLAAAHALGNMHRSLANTKAVNWVTKAMHHVGEGLEYSTSHPIKSATAVLRGGARAGMGAARVVRAGAQAVHRGLQAVNPASWTAPGHIAPARIRLNSRAVYARNAVQPTDYDPGSIQDLKDPSSPSIQMVVELLKEAIAKMKQTGLWDQLNSAHGTQVMRSVMAMTPAA